ncbi:MAG TPA: pyridoxamine 5'-phosphate oxidase family protein [Methylomirabilota bacterium]|nr:pyridoxamine 5'-phosphate oxidase family protein [Methylomirabilota bacterium]
MNIELALNRLREAIEERGSGVYLITVSGDARPHAVYLHAAWENGRLAVSGVGATTAANAVARPNVSLLFPVSAAADYTLFVDGPATVETRGDDHCVVVTPTRAVFHRPGAPRDPASSCTSDCVPIFQAPTRVAPPR